jgi:hypothetical protein
VLVRVYTIGAAMRKKKHIEPVSDENLEPMFKYVSMLVFAAYAVPIILVGGGLVGVGVGIGYLIWGR